MTASPGGYAVIHASPASVSRCQRRAAVVASTPSEAPILVHDARGSICSAFTRSRSSSPNPAVAAAESGMSPFDMAISSDFAIFSVMGAIVAFRHASTL